ncbi:uncharacterized protein [Scyliorhinus torazame]|uniref:uncharacterized protein isoform X10 n=1 Tax=Scyliorhinus torazame TaxID=75743 RepID=UPI003B59B1AB
MAGQQGEGTTAEQIPEERKVNEPCLQPTEGENETPAKGKNQEVPTSDQCDRASVGALNPPQCTEGTQDEGTTAEQIPEERKVNEPGLQPTEGENETQAKGKNQEVPTREKCDRASVGALNPPQCTERTQDEGTTAEQILEERKVNEPGLQPTEGENETQAKGKNQEVPTSEQCDRASVGALNPPQCTERTQDEYTTAEQIPEERKVNEPCLQPTEGENETQAKGKNQEVPTSEKCDRASVGALNPPQCTERTQDEGATAEQILEERKVNEPGLQHTECENEAPAKGNNQEYTIAEQIPEERKVKEPGLQPTEGENETSAKGKNQEVPTSEKCDRASVGALNPPQCTECTQDEGTTAEQILVERKVNEPGLQHTECENEAPAKGNNQEYTIAEQIPEERKVKEPGLQPTEGENETPAKGKNQEVPTSEKCDRASVGALNPPQCTECTQDEYTIAEQIPEERKVKEPGLQPTEGENETPAKGKNQEVPTSEQCDRASVGALNPPQCTERTQDEGTTAEQIPEERKVNEPCLQPTEGENETPAKGKNQEYTIAEQIPEERKVKEPGLQPTEGENETPAKGKNQEVPTSEQCDRASVGALNPPQCTERTQDEGTTAEQIPEERKVNEPCLQPTEGENETPAKGKNQEVPTSEQCDRASVGALNPPQCTERTQDEGTTAEQIPEERKVNEPGLQPTEGENETPAKGKNQGSSKEKRPDRIEATARSPIKNQRKRHIDSVLGNASDSESPEPLKKSPKDTVPAHGLGSESPKHPKKSSKGTVQAHRLGSESLKKSSEKDGASVGRYLQKMPDGPRVAAKGNLELQPHPEPEKMDCSDGFNSVSPDEMQSEGDDVLTASAQNSTDEDVDSESEMEGDRLQDSTGPLTRQTFSDYGTKQITHKADIHQPTKYRETQNYTDAKQSGWLMKPSVADYGTKQPTQKADIRQPMKYRETQNYTAEKQSRWFMKPSVAADIRQPMKYRETQNYTAEKQSRWLMKPSVADYGTKQPIQKGAKFFWKLVIPITGLIAVLIACIFCLWISKVTDRLMLMEREELFLSKWKEMKTMFPNQQHDLWMRSSILLKKHIGTAVRTQPVILMFAAAQDASGTMQCLARRIGEVYASVFNSSTQEINGSDKKSLNSDRVKLELDEQLSSAFQEGVKAAIIHHFQDLPPPSTLLFYKYCDHENAAFKDVSLLITVLLDEPKLKPNMPLKDLEEMVMDFLKKKFCSDTPGEFNIMDADKLGGLWSRISHLVLPVRLEREIEDGDCPVLK